MKVLGQRLADPVPGLTHSSFAMRQRKARVATYKVAAKSRRTSCPHSSGEATSSSPPLGPPHSRGAMSSWCAADLCPACPFKRVGLDFAAHPHCRLSEVLSFPVHLRSWKAGLRLQVRMADVAVRGGQMRRVAAPNFAPQRLLSTARC